MDPKPNEEYLDIHEAAEVLEVNEEELRELAGRHQVPTHTVAGAFLRFKKSDIDTLEIKWRIERELFPDAKALREHKGVAHEETLSEKTADFWYFNDFYIFCSLILFVLLYFIVSSQ